MAGEAVQEQGRPERLELRLATVFTGGVSLAVWMGGVAREMNLLLLAHRAAGGIGGAGAAGARAKYKELLDLLEIDVSLDVLSGTSAGGINVAFLGLANARGCDLASLRDLWLGEGSLEGLLRAPSEQAPPSLLKGDQVLLDGLRSALGNLAEEDGTGENPTHVFITTTLLDGAQSSLRDDFDTAVRDTDHHGLFTFRPEQLKHDADVADALALAARASASFPAAFEPAYIPIGKPGPAGHPDMRPYLDAGCRTQFCADGGLLANRPLGPALQAIFDRPAETEVRRVLAYVVPTVEAVPTEHPHPRPDQIPGIVPGLVKDFDAATSQTNAAELKALKEHNQHVMARRRREEWLAHWVSLEDADTLFAQYRTAWIDDKAQAAAEQVLARVAAGARAADKRPSGFGADLETATAVARTALSRRIPARLPAERPGCISALTSLQRHRGPTSAAQQESERDKDLFHTLALFGQASLDCAKATVLDLLRESCHMHPDRRKDLQAIIRKVHAKTSRQASRWPITDLSEALGAPIPLGHEAEIPEKVETALSAPPKGPLEAWAAAWQALDEAVQEAQKGLKGRVVDGRLTFLTKGRKESPASPGRAARRLFVLQAAHEVLSAGETAVPQKVGLVEVSADTRTLLDVRSLASEKLTGLQLHHFGAFYKRSWRANDWMWGRLDGAGWLVHILLSPERLAWVARDQRADRATQFVWDKLKQIAGSEPPESLKDPIRTELAFLGRDPSVRRPSSLPLTSMWVADALQRLIAAEELPRVAEQVALDRKDGGSDRASAFERACQRTEVTRENAQQLLNQCQISKETLSGEVGTPLLTRTVVQTMAVTANAVEAATIGWKPLRPLMTMLSKALRLACTTVDLTARRPLMAGLGLLAIGAFAASSTASWISAAGLIAVLAGIIVLAVVAPRKLAYVSTGVLVAALAVLAAAGFIPYVKATLFPWLSNCAIPYLRDHPWAWAAFFCVLLVPPFWMVRDVFPRRPRQRQPS
ncbi:patatin-like protein [Streptomyces sp. NPDC054783]